MSCSSFVWSWTRRQSRKRLRPSRISRGVSGEGTRSAWCQTSLWPDSRYHHHGGALPRPAGGPRPGPSNAPGRGRAAGKASGPDEAEPLDDLRTGKGDVQGDRPAERVADHGRGVDLEPLEELREELPVEVEQLRQVRIARAPERGNVQGDHAVAREQPGHDAPPAVGRVPVAVDEQHGWTLAGVVKEGRHTAHLDQPVGDLPAPGVVQPRVSRTATHLFPQKATFHESLRAKPADRYTFATQWLAC